jgi:4-amino-4-deoxy-L-arabinose transferase-like glycosyltransferase
VDDAWFMAQAQHVLRIPAADQLDICWFGNEECGKSWTMASGQAMEAYLLVPAILAGGAEWVAHLMEMLFAALAIVSMIAVALRLGYDRHYARLAGLLLMATPPFLPAASSAMPDIPALGLGLFGLERLLAWKTFGRGTTALASALAASNARLLSIC